MRTSAERYYLPKVVTPATGRRKARILCQVQGCLKHIIETQLLCDDCWRCVPAEIKREYRSCWRSLKSITVGDGKELWELLSHARDRASIKCIEAGDVFLQPTCDTLTIHSFRDKLEAYLTDTGWQPVEDGVGRYCTFRSKRGVQLTIPLTIHLQDVPVLESAIGDLARIEGVARPVLAIRIKLYKGSPSYAAARPIGESSRTASV